MNGTALLPPCYLPPVGYLSVLMRYERVIIDVHEHYVKQTYRNRCYVASPHGPTALTVPVAHPSPSPAMCEAALSDHGNWRHVHLTALDSYYRHTPYYDYYRDDLLPFYTAREESLADYDIGLLRLVCELAGIGWRAELSTAYIPPQECAGIDDYRSLMTPKADPATAFPAYAPRPYYQVFARRLGFLPHLSCIDLLLNMGPETPLYL